MPGTFLVVAAIAALVDVVVLRSLFAAEGFTTAASLVLAKVVALLAAAGVRFVLYRAVLLGAVRRGLQARTARTPAGGSDRKSVVEGKSVVVRVDLGGRRIIKKKKEK